MSAVWVKLGLFAVSAAIAGLGGVLYASYNGSVTHLDFPPLVGVVWLAVAVTFGVRRPGLAVVAGLVYGAAPELISWFTDSTVVPQILFGLGGIGLARNPDGFLSRRHPAVGHLALPPRVAPDLPAPADLRLVVGRGQRAGRAGFPGRWRRPAG